MRSPKDTLANGYYPCCGEKVVVFVAILNLDLPVSAINSSVENIVALPIDSIHVLIRRVGFKSRLVTAISLQ